MISRSLARRSALACALALAWAGSGCGREAAGRIDNVLLISIDTCRADYLSSYGSRRAATPHIDLLAAEGVRFERAISPVPLTLPAHASLLTGTTPPFHGVRANATYRLAPQNLTLAEILAGHGFATGAVVSAFVLDSRFGLDQGFAHYDDSFEAPIAAGVIDQRRGDEVTRRASAWLAENGRAPFFLFLHYYDPHTPYDAPEPFASEFADDPYAAEIAYVDYVVGQVIDELKRLELYETTLIVLTADHGEMLGEHGEATHGWFVYESAIRVPLIVRAPGVAPATVVDLAGLIDVVPTVCGLLGIPLPAEVQGVDLSPLLRGTRGPREPRELYCESLEPTQYGCNPLLGLVGWRFKYIETTRPELYDLEGDPGESRDLHADTADRAAELAERLAAQIRDSVRQLPAAAPALDPEARRRIEALGYLAGAAPAELLVDRTREDPKDLIEFHHAHLAVPPLIVQGELAEARRQSEKLLEERPDFTDGHLLLARIAREERRLDDAVRHYERALELSPDRPGVHADLGVVLALLDRGPEAIEHYRRALALDPDHVEARNNLGNELLKGGRSAEALHEYRRALELRPDSAETWLNAAIAHLRLGDAPAAAEALSRAEHLVRADDARTLDALAAIRQRLAR